MSDETTESASVESKEDFKQTPSEFVRHWLEAIELAGKEEKDWHEKAEDCVERYRKTKGKQFNILYANTQTTVPALYNSEPIPDIRRRFGEDDPIGKAACRIIERALTIQAEQYDFDGAMKAAVKDRQLPGRGVTRVRVKVGAAGSKWIQAEQVVWSDFRRGPAKVWSDVPWVAFRHKMTKDDLEGLAPELANRVELDAMLADAKGKDKSEVSDQMKRATVWEIWCKEDREVYFIAESYRDGPLKVIPDPYKLRDFLPVPRPLLAVETTDSLIPVCEFTLWKPLADEVDTLTARISSIVKVMKWRGLYHGAFTELVSRLKDLEDGELAAAEDSARAMSEGGIDKAIWMMPVADAAILVEKLYAAREQAQQQVYQMTGVADILRGSTQASETATAQQIKAQWGSLRLQEAQREVQRYARDLFRMMADLTAEHLEPAELSAMTGMQLQPEVLALLKSGDVQRDFVIEIETDSTIRADLTRAQETLNAFIQGVGPFVQGFIGPAVQGQMMPPEIGVKMLSALSVPYKLGRQMEAAFTEWEQWLAQKAQQPQQAPPPDPRVEAEAQHKQAQIEDMTQRREMDKQERVARFMLEQQNAEKDHARKDAEANLKAQQFTHQQKVDADRMAFDRESKQAEREHAVGMFNAKAAADRETKAQAQAEMASGHARTLEIAGHGPGFGQMAAGMTDMGSQLAQAIAQQGDQLRIGLEAQGQGLAQLAQAIMADEQVEAVRGEDGKMMGAIKRRVPPQLGAS